ncbi:translocation/assembly module TamB domain-containing protein [Arcicella aquatica]|uniref:Translocation/assembly module TamB domain-containing protein n=1 Tax=Arcicella aquatica TaxID=217141 RepID=A0ABU5QH38_9BACT|nr:translocation/assembly module TamB domain-containing protein [Arcicella aquatica]MEA5256365.1 translocation/assembly module TamB domain-containing protein [Arcicella aquatica]
MFIKVSKILTKIILYTVVGLLLLAVLGSLALRSSYLQTRIAQYYAPKISQALGYPIEIDKVTIRFFDEATLEGVRVKDYQNHQMIDIEKLDLDFQLKSLLQDSLKTRLDYVRLYHPKVGLVTDKNGDLNIDEFIRRINKLTASPTPNPKHKPTPFIIGEADIVEGIFSMNDESEPYMNDRKSFDHYHFKLHELNAHLKNFTLIRDTVTFQTTLKAYDRSSDLRIKTLKTHFLISDTQMRFDDLLLKVNNSVIRNNIVMSFKSQKDFKHWNAKVKMHANFDSSVVVANDIARFVNDMYQYKDVYYLNGKFDGTVNEFKLHNFDLYFGQKSKLRGDFSFKGLPDIPTTDMDFNMRKSYVFVNDLEKYIGKDPVKAIEKFNNITFDGVFKGTTSNFKTTGLITSDLGKSDVDVAMVLKANEANSTYKGSLKLEDFKLGKLIENAGSLGDISLSGKIEGIGFSLKNASLNFDGTVKQITYNDYNYKNIDINGKLAKELFDGRIAVKDTNLVLNVFSKVDLRNGKSDVDMLGKLSKANLKHLHFTKDDWRISTILDVQSKGKNIDELVGKAKFINTYVTLDKRNLILDSLYITSTIEEIGRKLNIESDLVNLDFKGNFKPSQAFDDLKVLVEEYKIYFVGDEATRNAYYAKKPLTPPQNYQIDYQFYLKNFDPILGFYYPDGHISKKTLIEGTFGISNTSTFSLSSKIDTLVLGQKYRFYQSDIDLNSSKFYNTPEILASLILNSKKQKLGVLAPTVNLEAEASWAVDRIGFTSGLKQEGTTNQVNLNGTLQFIQDGLALQFKRSKFHLLDQDWKISPDNSLTIIGNEITAKDLYLSNLDQLIALNGTLSEDSLKNLTFKAKNFQLETLAPIISLNMKGLVNAEVDLKNIYKNINVDSRLSIKDLYVDNFLIGNVTGDGIFDNERQLVDINYSLERLQNQVLTIRGIYDPKQAENSLDLLATLNQTNLQILEPFTKGLFSKIGGVAIGTINVSGKPSHPILEGAIDIKRGTLFFDYLKSTLNFEDKITFEPDEVRAKSLRLTDDEGNKGTLKGSVFFDGDKTFNVQLGTTMNRFKILNTTRRDNDTYYGTAYATGKLNLGGTFDNLTISADLRSDRGTKLYIPLDKAQDAGNQEEIEFMSARVAKDSLNKNLALNNTSTSGIKMDFNFEITPDAYGEVQFDKQTGDIMRANGSGIINLKVDTRGGFDMTGDYNIERGDYTFTFQNIINKKFNIQRGSKISWSGNPYEAIVDIRAAYTQNLSYLGSVIDSTGRGKELRSKADYTRRYPVDITINLKDRLLQPTISFNLRMHDYPQNPDFNSAVTAFENRMKTDEQELNRQVSNVLLLGQMVSQTNASAFAAANLVSNLTELLSNQLSNVFSKIDQNLNVDLSLNGNGLNQDLINNLQLRLSYNFNDRFRITRSGGFTTATNQTNAQSLIGDWALEWFITKDGSLRFKTYNRNIQTSILGALNTYQTFTSGGASLLYTKSFNYLFINRKKARNPLAQTDEPVIINP